MTRVPRGARALQWRRQHQEKNRRWPTLNLVAFMDVFTILVFFFLVHTTDVAVATDRYLVRLPESTAGRPPRSTLVVMITRDDIRVQGEPVIRLDKVGTAGGSEIKELRQALAHDLQPDAHGKGGEVTILGDKSIPFALLKKVMVTCSRAGYTRISLAVLQRTVSG
jgi:biopolymer transport protein TolR